MTAGSALPIVDSELVAHLDRSSRARLVATAPARAAKAGVALVPTAARKFRRGAVVYRMLEPALANIETAIAWRRADKSPMLAEFIGAARHRLSVRAH